MERDRGVGRVDVENQPVHVVWLPFTLLRFGLTMGVLVAVPLVAATWSVPANPLWGALAAGALMLYLVVGYFLRPRPNLDNVGLAGGLIDHPFRWSDDGNRFLWQLQIALFPGYLLARPVAEVFYWLAGEAEAS